MDEKILFFFDGHLEALPMYEKLERQILQRMPEVVVKVAKTQITFANRCGFAFVSFNPCRRAKERPPVWMTVSFGLDRQIYSPRIDAAVEAYPGRWTHHVMVGSPEEVDEQLMQWICAAGAFSQSKRRKA